jgi:hypothetical protein
MGMNRAVLEKPFDATQIRQRRGRTGGVLDYVEGHTVIARLNEAFEGAWSFEITWHEIRETEVLVLGKLTAEGVVKCQFGGSSVTRDRETKQPVSLGDDLKGAATDALKKCATFLGVGLHLYAEKPIRAPDATPRPAAKSGPPTQASSPPRSPEANPPPPVTGDALLRGGRVTPRQLAAIWRLARAKGLEPGAVDGMSLRVFNRKPDALTSREASALIQELSTMKRQVA